MVNYKVYKHTSPSGKVYIGITCQELRRRFMNGRGYKQCPRIANAIKKYGWDNFKHEILFEGLTKEEAEKKEIELIQKYKSNDKRFGYNIDNGGNTSGTHSEATKRKISEGNKGRIVTEETKAKWRRTFMANGSGKGEKNYWYGKTIPESVRKKVSETNKGNQYFKGHHHTDEFKKRKSVQMHEKYKDGKHPRCTRVIHYDEMGNIIKIYVSLTEVADELKHSKSTIYSWVHDANNKEWTYEQGA